MIISSTDSLFVQHDEEFGLLRFQWHEATATRILPAISQGLDLIQRHQPAHLLIDLNQLPAITIEQQLQLTTRGYARVATLKLQCVAFVLSAGDEYNQLTLETMLWANRHRIQCDIQFFEDALTGLKWLVGSSRRAAALELEWQQALHPEPVQPICK